MRTRLWWLPGALVVGALACGGSTSKGSGDDGDGGSSSSGGGSGGSSGSSGSSGGSGSSSGSSGGSGSSSGGSSGGLPFTTAVTIIVEPSDDADALVSAIQGAKTSVHMTMYLLSNTRVIDALIAQHMAGHDVKVLLNKTFPATGADSGSNAAVYTQLQSAGVTVEWAPPGFTDTHEKGVLIDGTVAWIMTMNATESSPTANREYLAVDTDPNDYTEAETIFEADWADMSLTPKGNLVVSPTNSSAKLLALLGMATKSIDMEAEELTDSGVVGALEAAAMKGIAVHVVLADATSTTQATALKAAGVQLVTFSKYYVHAKSIVVDGEYAYVGSENFSTGSLSFNRELGVVTNTASEVAKVASTTASDFAAGTAL
jgi:cardiolipin synthase